MLFGSKKDFDLLVSINSELISRVIEQEIGYYKLSLNESQVNLYGENINSPGKQYLSPVLLNCLIKRGDQENPQDEFGVDLERNASFAFLKNDLVSSSVFPQVGDIILWHEDYYEVDTIKENQLFVGRDHQYNFTNYGARFGSSFSIVCECHQTRVDKTGIVPIK